MRLTLGFILVLVLSTTASAQSAYVGAAFFGDVVRTSGSTGEGTEGGETFGGALRFGTPLGTQWGVELEFARSGELDDAPRFSPLTASRSFTFSSSSTGVVQSIPAIFPAPSITSTRQLTTISPMLWWSHEVSQRLSLVYLGGVAFTRAESSLRFEYEPFPLPVPLPGGLPGLPIRAPQVIESEAVSYDADVAVGFEARIGMTEHLRLTPGIRMQTVTGGWAIRPAVGLLWMF